jgi:hypothetical protein
LKSLSDEFCETSIVAGNIIVQQPEEAVSFSVEPKFGKRESPASRKAEGGLRRNPLPSRRPSGFESAFLARKLKTDHPVETVTGERIAFRS